MVGIASQQSSPAEGITEADGSIDFIEFKLKKF